MGFATPAEGAAAAEPGWPALPSAGWPSRETVEYLTKLIILILLLIALPHLLGHVTTSKGSRAAAAMGGAAAI